MEKLLKLLRTKYPIIQAPMAGSDNPAMIAAASQAGALGSLGAQYRTPEEIREAIREIRRLTDKPFAVNLFALPPLTVPCAQDVAAAIQSMQACYARFALTPPTVQDVQNQIDAEAQLAVLVEESVPVFSFTLGTLASRWLEAFKAKGTIIIGTATNCYEARLLAESGVDAICVQGAEAGGHRGTFTGNFNESMIGLMALLPQIAGELHLPLIAAGGIMDGRGIAAALALGASGVQMGTAFLTTTECPVHASYKDAIVAHDAEETTITKVFSGGAARSITNKFIEEQAASQLLPFPFHNSVTRPFRKVAIETGDIDYTNLWSGQAGRLARAATTAALIEALVMETNAALEALGGMRF